MGGQRRGNGYLYIAPLEWGGFYVHCSNLVAKSANVFVCDLPVIGFGGFFTRTFLFSGKLDRYS